MALEALINTITLACLVLFGLWIIAHVAQAIELLLMRCAYRRHSKSIFTIPFVPLQTRLFHEVAVPQYLAAEAIQRGDLPPAPRLPVVGSVEHVSPGVAPSLTLPGSSSTPLLTKNSVLTGSPLSTLSNTDDGKAQKRNKTTSPDAEGTSDVGGRASCRNREEANGPVAVAVRDQPTTRGSTADDTANPSWWSPKLEGQDLVLGLQLPLQLQSSTSRAFAARLEKEVHGTSAAAPPPDRASRSSSSKARGGGGGKSGTAGAPSPTTSGPRPRQPTVNLQLRQYRLTSASLASLTATCTSQAYGPASHVRSASHVDTQRGGRHREKSGSYSSVHGSPVLQAAISAQLATAPMQVTTRLMASTSVPRPLYPIYTASRGSAATTGGGGGGARGEGTGVLDFDAIKYAYVRNYQRLLEVAVAEQTAMAHRAQHDRKSAKRAQRIAAVLMQYLQYTHEDDEDETVLDDSLEEDGDRGDGDDGRACRNTSELLHSSSLQTANSSMMDSSAAPADSSGDSAPSRRRGKESPWVPLLGDSRDEPFGGRHPYCFSAPASAAPKRLSRSFSQLSIATPPSSVTHHQQGQRGKAKPKKGNGDTSPTKAGARAIATPTSIVLPPPVHETRRSNRKRREAAQEIADSAVDALETLVERVRQAQALRPRYRALLLTVNFRAERFVVRRGASGPPTWTALSRSSQIQGTGVPLSSPVAGAEGRETGSRLPKSLTRARNDHSSSSVQRQKHSRNSGGTNSGVYDFTHSDLSDLVPESSLASAVDPRAEKSDCHSRTSPPSPDQSTEVPTRRSLIPELTEEMTGRKESFGSPPNASDTSRRSDANSFLLAGVSSLPGVEVTSDLAAPLSAAAGASLPTPLAAFATAIGSTSANDAAVEFLRASRRLKLEVDLTQLSGEYSQEPSTKTANRLTPRSSESRENSGNGSGSSTGSPLGHGRLRFAGDPAALRGVEETSSTGNSQTQRQNTSSVFSGDGDALRPPSPKSSAALKKVARAPSRVPPTSLAPAAAERHAVDALSPSPLAAPTVAAVAAPRAPREADLRIVYMIGADRTTLLRSLTLHATQTFSGGAQNFLCFFTSKDEQRARRRYLEEMDRQYRRELQQRAAQRTRAMAQMQKGTPTNDMQSDGDIDAARLQSYRMEAIPPPSAASAAPSRTTSGLGAGPALYARATSWHSVGMGGSGIFSSDSADFKDAEEAGGSITALQDTRYGPPLSLHSLHSFAGDSATGFAQTLPLDSTPTSSSPVVTVHAQHRSDPSRDEGLFNSSITLSPHSLEASLHASGEGLGQAHRRRTSVFNAATESFGTQGFETVPSLPSSMLSASNSIFSLPSQRESTIVGAGLPQDETAGDASATAHASISEVVGQQNITAAVEEEDILQSCLSSDNAFAHSLHSVDSVTDSGVAELLTEDVRGPPHSSLTVEVSASPAPPRTPLSGLSVSYPPPSAKTAMATLPHTSGAGVPTADQREANHQIVSEEAGVKQKKVCKRPSSPTLDKSDLKSKSKRELKAASSAAAAAESAAALERMTPKHPASVLPLPAPQPLELPDTIGDHDVRRYHAAIGVTLPEQVFFLHDVPIEDEAPGGTNASTPHGGGGSPGRWNTSGPSTQSAAVPPATQTYPTVTASARHTAPWRSVTRVLEGQVEVAELSLDVLSRQLSPFIPQNAPTATPRVNKTEEDTSENHTANQSDSGSTSDSDSDHSSESSPSNSGSSSNSDDKEDDYSHRRRDKKTHRATRQRHQQKTRASGKAKGSREEREARLSSKNKTRGGKKRAESRREARSSAAAAAASRATRHRRRRRQQRQQQRRIAVWRQRLLRKQAAVTKAGLSPVSLAALFFTAPPQLPLMLLHRLEGQRTAYEHSALPIPSWAMGTYVSGTPLGVTASRRAGDSPRSSFAEPALQQQQRAAICVTLIYTSTAEQVTQTLLVAGEMAASSKRAPLALRSSSSLENSLTSLGVPGGQRRGSWLDELREGPHGERRHTSVAGRFGAALGAEKEDSFSFRGAASINTIPRTPNESFHATGRTRGADSLYNSLTASPPPHVESGTATFAGDDTSSFSSDRQRIRLPSRDPRPTRSANATGASSGLREGCGSGTAAEEATEQQSPPLPPLVLLTDSSNTFDEDSQATSPALDKAAGGGIARSATSVFMDINGSLDRDSAEARRVRKEDTLCFDEETPTNVITGGGYRSSGPGGVDAQRFDAVEAEAKAEEAGTFNGGRRLSSVADSVVDVLRDASSFPDGVPVGVSLTYVRIGNDLYAVTEVVDRTFLQYREERVIHPNTQGTTEDGGDAASVLSSASSVSDMSDDPESRTGTTSALNASFSSDTPFSALDAALEAIQSQHEASARQQRRRMHHRRRAVSTMNFGDLSYSLAGSAPVRPGTRRQEVHMCWRCLSAEAAVIFLPCGHYAVCEDCAEVLADCCVCKTPILSSVVLLERKKTQTSLSVAKSQQQQQQSRRHRSAREPRPEQ